MSERSRKDGGPVYPQRHYLFTRITALRQVSPLSHTHTHTHTHGAQRRCGRSMCRSHDHKIPSKDAPFSNLLGSVPTLCPFAAGTSAVGMDELLKINHHRLHRSRVPRRCWPTQQVYRRSPVPKRPGQKQQLEKYRLSHSRSHGHAAAKGNTKPLHLYDLAICALLLSSQLCPESLALAFELPE